MGEHGVYDWALTQKELGDIPLAKIVQTLNAAAVYVKKYGIEGDDWIDPLNDENIDDITPFINLEDWQMEAIKNIATDGEIRLNVRHVYQEYSSFIGFSRKDDFFAGTVVSAAMKAYGKNDPIIIDYFSHEEEQAGFLIFGPDGCFSTSNIYMKKEQLTLFYGITSTCGAEKALEMLEAQKNILLAQLGNNESCKPAM